MDKKYTFVSIIIPVYNDSKRLSKCLEALENQTYPKKLYEVIVVDNNSEEDIGIIVDQFAQATITHESHRGSYAARNKGISLAKAAVLGFTDSDCIPAPNWIEKGVENLLQTANCGFVAGKIKLFFQNPDKPTVVELYDSNNFLRQKQYVEELKFGATANLFTYKDVFDLVGLFNADLKSSGDREWGQRVFKLGYTQIYAEDVCIAHPARNKLKELQKKVARITEGLYDVDKPDKKSLIPFLHEVFLDIKPPAKDILKILKDNNSESIYRKTQYTLLLIFLRWVRARKRLQLYFG